MGVGVFAPPTRTAPVVDAAADDGPPIRRSMSPIGKIFTVLNLVLAGLFLGWAANAVSAGTDFKKRYEDEVAAHKATTAALGTEKSKLLTDKQELESVRQQLTAQRDEARGDLARLREDLTKQETQNSQLSASVTAIQTSLENIVSSKDKAEADKTRAMQAQHEAETKMTAAEAAQRAAEEKLADLQQQFATAETSIADLEKTRESMRKEQDRIQTQLDTLVRQTGVSLSELTSMPDIDGRVISVVTTPAPGLVAINKGKNDGVKAGFTFDIYDGATYKGRVRVDFVHDTTSSAVILNTRPGQTIRQGDSASTQI